jgi:hypothetical protein
VANPYVPVSSLFSQAKMREIHRDLAQAMQLYPDDDPFFFRNLGRNLDEGHAGQRSGRLSLRKPRLSA